MTDDDTAAALRARVRELTDDGDRARAALRDGHAAAIRDVAAERDRLRDWLTEITWRTRGKGAALASQALHGAPAPRRFRRRERPKT